MNSWIRKSIFYHIYPLGFCGAEEYRSESSETPVNRIQKVTAWIPHLKEMHINALYIGPLFESTKHGYDTIDYKTCDRRLGTNEDLKAVCDELHANGIKVIFDGVFNHVGREFFAFKDVQQNRENSPYCSWFHNLDFNGNTVCNDGFYYEGWNGFYDLVKLNLQNQDVVNYLVDAIDFWINTFHIDGIRFDAADCLDIEFIKNVHSFTRSKNQDFLLIGEIVHGDYSYWANDEMFDSVTNYECYHAIFTSHNERNYFNIMGSVERQYGEFGVYKNLCLYNFLDNHDVNRIASALDNPDTLQCAYTLLYTMCGAPSIYYGSEFGLKGIRTENSDSGLRPCINIDNIPDKNSSLYELICRLGKIREENIILQEGSFEIIELKNQAVLFKRVRDNCTVYVALNISDWDYIFNFNCQYRTLEDKLTGEIFKESGGNNFMSIRADKNQARILVQANDALQPGTVSSQAPTQESAPAAPESYIPAPLPIPHSDILPAGESGQQLVIGGHYRHFKGGEYVVLSVGRHSETLETLVVYQRIDRDVEIWIRPLNMFLENVNDHGNIKPRFELIN